VIEHNLDVIKCADHVIDLGPDGGNNGGNLVIAGTPEEVAACGDSITGVFLKKKLEADGKVQGARAQTRKIESSQDDHEGMMSR
jgi:hypothetical protein